MHAHTLPGPFEWVTIPGGMVTLEPGGYLPQPTTFEVEPFAITRYPVTNHQYAAFMEAGGYTHRAWWTDEGWAIKARSGWTEPRYWKKRGDCPVMGVSWYEALAFCRWLSIVTGEPVSLPTEQQWQRAAQGDDGREYPWGNEPPNEILCNWNRNASGTTPVTQYPDGASPYGVMDMSGNVWELCLTGWQSGAWYGAAHGSTTAR
jgi:formylglycine-generating enzyme required for sulfatase activity